MNDTSPSSDQKPIIGVGVVVLRKGPHGPEVLLIQRGKPPRQGEWSMPGGKQEWGETLHEAAHREIMEETGVRIANLKLIDVVDGLMRDAGGVLNRHLTLIDYRADWVSGEPRAGDDAQDARWVPLADLSNYRLWSETTRVILAGATMDGSI
jgi:ADP-ribose pyrophosphatase YjhB (NUDIX family)